MDVLSRSDGSAQAVQDAAEAATSSRMGLERELDRLNGGLASHAEALAQHLNWTLLAQAFLVTAYFIVLVGGWSIPLPGKRWLLSSIAGYGAISLVLGYLSLRAHRDRIAPLRQSRRLTEQALERVASRPPVFSRENLLSTTVGMWSSRLLPLVILLGWGALTFTRSPCPCRRMAAWRGRLEARQRRRLPQPGRHATGHPHARPRRPPRRQPRPRSKRATANPGWRRCSAAPSIPPRPQSPPPRKRSSREPHAADGASAPALMQ
jgi:hypothetical protein